MKNIKLTLEVDEVNAVIQILGQMPTSSNVWMLMQKVRAQAELALKQAEAKDEPTNEEEKK